MRTWEQRADHFSENFEARPFWTIGKMVVVVVLVLILLSACGWAFRMVMYPANQAQRIYEKTLDADNVIYNYEYFKQAYHDIKAMDEKERAARAELLSFTDSSGPRSGWDFRDKDEHARLSANVTGIQQVRAEMVSQYNARANMVNRKIFMGTDVPAQVN